MAPSVRQRNHAHSRKDVKKLGVRKSVGNARQEENRHNPNPSEMGLLFPNSEMAFKTLLSARLCAAIWSHISDCDETYNYWEPTHYLLFGKGFQTWEYSPKYALRSYMYLLLHAAPAWLHNHVFQPNRFMIFYGLRLMLALFCAICENYFYRTVCREFGVHIGRLMLAFMVFSAGMFISSTAFLPSSFSMCMMMVALGAWFERKYELAIFATGLSSFISWPFSVLLGVPIALDLVFWRKEVMKFLQWSGISIAVILLPMVKTDSSYFGRLVIAPYNIIHYNIFTNHGPNLYGTEPLSFYFINGFLNFNFVFLAALVSPACLFLCAWLVPSKPRIPGCLPYFLSLMPMFLWIAVFFSQPHKEERFLFPIYPLICLNGAITVDALQKLWFFYFVQNSEKPSHYLKHTVHITVAVIIVCSLLGISRSFALYKGYHAPLDTFMQLNQLHADKRVPNNATVNVCIGKEWYRYPSSFFLPENNWNLQFLKSEFRGQLPKPYSITQNATSIIPEFMNDMNKEEPSRYFNIENCHFLVDLDLEGRETEHEANYSHQKEKWTIFNAIPFLDAEKSHRFFRAFFVPVISEKFCTFAPYNLLISTKFKLRDADEKESN